MKTLFLGALSLLLLIEPTAPPAQPESAAPPPRLVVVVVIDQFRADYLVRFHDGFGPEGFNRLLRQGANFTSCFYPYAHTVTAPGHSTLATGTTPDRHGIVGNNWYDHKQGREVQAVEDASAPLVGDPARRGAGVSPRNLVGNTLADELRLATEGEAKVFGVAIKDRAAVFSTGHTASGAYWYHRPTGSFVTSRYYREQMPDWVVAFNQERAAASYYGKDWKGSDRVFVSMTTKSGQSDEAFYRRFPFTPYGNDIVVDFAGELVRQEGLGADEVTDLLFVGLSSNDYAGHEWGPYSDEVADMTLRTDAQIARLLSLLDERVGAGNYWFVLSGDHGVAPTLAQARQRGIAAKSINRGALKKALKEAFTDKWGKDKWFIFEGGIIFERETLRKRGVSLAQAAHLAGSVLGGIDGILGYVAGDDAHLDPGLAEAVRLSTYPGRAPDVYIVREPFALVGREKGGTTHGSPHSYDTHVPLVFFGPAFRPETHRQRVSPADLAPTLAAALGINPPALATGKVLSQALRRQRPQPAPSKK